MAELWTPPDGEYAKVEALKKKQAACTHHLHFVDHAESKMDPVFAVECCRCELKTTITQPEGRACRAIGPIVTGAIRVRKT